MQGLETSIIAFALLRGRDVWLRFSFALLLSIGLYAFQFLYEGGHEYVSPDGESYLAMATGTPVPAPYSHRILKPSLASLASSLSGLSPADVFRILTPLELLASLLTMLALLQRRKSPQAWQWAVLVAFGTALAASFGHAPVLVDPMVLLLSCLFIVALDRDYLLLGLVLSCMAALTKEYGALLGFAWAAYVYRRGLTRLALPGAFLPVLLFFLATKAQWQAASPHSAGLFELMRGSAAYELQLLKSSHLPKVLYIWSWAVLWPVLLLAVMCLIARLRTPGSMDAEHVASSVMLLAAPFLLIGDWDRSLLIVVPFACIAATAHPLTGDTQFTALLSIGGLCTALGRPLYTSLPAPTGLTVSITVLSLVASILIGVKIMMFSLRTGVRAWARR